MTLNQNHALLSGIWNQLCAHANMYYIYTTQTIAFTLSSSTFGLRRCQLGASPVHRSSFSRKSQIFTYRLQICIISVPSTFLLAITNWYESSVIYPGPIIFFFWSIWLLKWSHREMEGQWNWESFGVMIPELPQM